MSRSVTGRARRAQWRTENIDTDKIGQEAKEVGGKVAEGAKAVGATVKEGAKEVASDVGARKQTLDVKVALMAAKGIDASHIDVDTDADTKTVTLKGTVPTAAPTTINLRPITRRRILGRVCRTVRGVAGR